MDKVCIGKITSPFGIKGEVKVYSYARTFNEFKQVKNIFLENNEKYSVEKARFDKGLVLLKLKELSDRNTAQALQGMCIYALKEEYTLEKDSYLVEDILGLDVYSEKDVLIGKLSDVIQNSSQDVYEITKNDGKTFLVPAVKEFIKNIDLEKKKIVLHIIDGLID